MFVVGYAEASAVVECGKMLTGEAWCLRVWCWKRRWREWVVSKLRKKLTANNGRAHAKIGSLKIACTCGPIMNDGCPSTRTGNATIGAFVVMLLFLS